MGHLKETRFFLLRHARTVWNLEKRIQGQRNSPLAAVGQRQADSWGAVLKPCAFDRVITSDLGRVRDTAARINRELGLSVHEDSRLREQDWGGWTGNILSELRRKMPEEIARQEASGWRFCPPDGESRLAVWQRSSAALLAAGQRWPGEKILVVTHEGVLKTLIYRILGRRFLPEEPKVIRPLHLHELTSLEGELAAAALNVLALPTPKEG